ncbi:hypothetical protein ON010_g13518 [Phytophthora cinnamomi]|nr:hypothetical protein ON010_g13518 [Phytophthora cinnamomi]
MSWDGDALAILFGHMKNDQDGTRPRDARHVYANPFIPEICPVLAGAIYAAVLGITDSKIFPGGNQYDRPSKILNRVMEEDEKKVLLENEGLLPSGIGTHSARTGSATFVSSCSNGGPSAAAKCIRAGWKLPGVQDTYIRHDAAGDRIVGRYGLGYHLMILTPFVPQCPFRKRQARAPVATTAGLSDSMCIGSNEAHWGSSARSFAGSDGEASGTTTAVIAVSWWVSADRGGANEVRNVALSKLCVNPRGPASVSRARSDCGIFGLVQSVRNHLPCQLERSVEPDESHDRPTSELSHGSHTLTVVGLLWLTTLAYTSRYVYDEALEFINNLN